MIPRFKAHLTGRRVLGAIGACYGLAACLFTGTTFVPAAYTGAFIWGITAAVFSTVTLTTLQRAVPAAVHGRVMGVTAAVDSWVETIGLPLGGLTLAGLGIRAGGPTLAGVAILAGLTVALTSPAPSPSDPAPDQEGASS
jgi:predicted MFS family arabinose efflux permease